MQLNNNLIINKNPRLRQKPKNGEGQEKYECQ
jgi:hypothetical protein